MSRVRRQQELLVQLMNNKYEVVIVCSLDTLDTRYKVNKRLRLTNPPAVSQNSLGLLAGLVGKDSIGEVSGEGKLLLDNPRPRLQSNLGTHRGQQVHCAGLKHKSLCSARMEYKVQAS